MGFHDPSWSSSQFTRFVFYTVKPGNFTQLVDEFVFCQKLANSWRKAKTDSSQSKWSFPKGLAEIRVRAEPVFKVNLGQSQPAAASIELVRIAATLAAEHIETTS